MNHLTLSQRAQLWFVENKLRAIYSRYSRLSSFNPRIHWRKYKAYAANAAHSAESALRKVECLLNPEGPWDSRFPHP